MELEWTWSVARWTLLGIGVAAFAIGLFWDRARGRRRCPKCWYDMTGVPRAVGDGAAAYVCPECGHGVTGERGLFKTRRRWVLIAVGLVFAAGSHAVYLRPFVRERGWPAAVPGLVLVYAADPADEFFLANEDRLFHDAKRRLYVELAARLRNVEDCLDDVDALPIPGRCFGILGGIARGMPDWECGLWARRVAVFIKESKEHNPEASPVLVYSLAHLSRRACEYDAVTAQLPVPDWTGNKSPIRENQRWLPAWEAELEIQRLIVDSVRPDGWADHGGTEAFMVPVRSWIVVLATVDTHRQVASLLERLETEADATAPCTEPSPDGHQRWPAWMRSDGGRALLAPAQGS